MTQDDVLAFIAKEVPKDKMASAIIWLSLDAYRNLRDDLGQNASFDFGGCAIGIDDTLEGNQMRLDA